MSRDFFDPTPEQQNIELSAVRTNEPALKERESHYLDLGSLDPRFLVRTRSFDSLIGFSGSFAILRSVIRISSASRSRLFANPSTSPRYGSGSSLARLCSCSASFSNFSRRARNNSSSSRLVIAIFSHGFSYVCSWVHHPRVAGQPGSSGWADGASPASRRFRKKELFVCRIQFWWRTAAAMYSLIGSAKLNGLDPEAYLSHILARIAHMRACPHEKAASAYPA